MDWTKTNPLERVVEWGAPIVLATAVGWSARLAGLPLAAMAASGMLALTFGVIVMRMAGRAAVAGVADFQPVEFEADEAGDELLLDNPVDELLLDDPLVAAPDSRVVQLFARQEPTPGELVLRISDFLNDGSRPTVAEAPAPEQQYPDASDALQAALANIRASLR
jgi:hypothetical protein